jgi:tetratricopeptide (TPR) repeat protein
MDIPSSLEQARQWLREGLFAQAEEMLSSLRRQLEAEPQPKVLLEVFRGLLAVAEIRGQASSVQEIVPKMLQTGREIFDFDSQPMGDLLHQAGKALASAGAGADAETFLLQAYRRLPQDRLVKFQWALRLGYFYASFGHPGHGLRWAKDAETKAETAEEKELATRAVASLLDAIEKGLEAQALRQPLLDHSPWMALDQARSQRRLGWASKADNLYRKALPGLPPKEQPRVYRELALTRLSRRDLAGAEQALVEGLQLCPTTSFEHHLLRAEQARLWQYQGRFAEAETVLREVLANWHERFQPHHPLCLKLSEVLVELGILKRDFSGALLSAQELLKTASQAYGEDHPSVARGLFWMALVWLYQNERPLAKQALVQAQFIWDQWEDVSDVERAQIHFGMGLVLVDELEFYPAEEQLRKAMELVEQQGLGGESAMFGYLLQGLSEVHKVTGRDRQAQEAADKSQELLRPRR